ncbi:hypothetical protein C8R43DRAFT_1004446 [Mycena crocata]|nr:hypothetical protein C8R43DRAFT_1004446 [Mycena crocata]
MSTSARWLIQAGPANLNLSAGAQLQRIPHGDSPQSLTAFSGLWDNENASATPDFVPVHATLSPHDLSSGYRSPLADATAQYAVANVDTSQSGGVGQYTSATGHCAAQSEYPSLHHCDQSAYPEREYEFAHQHHPDTPLHIGNESHPSRLTDSSVSQSFRGSTAPEFFGNVMDDPPSSGSNSTALEPTTLTRLRIGALLDAAGRGDVWSAFACAERIEAMFAGYDFNQVSFDPGDSEYERSVQKLRDPVAVRAVPRDLVLEALHVAFVARHTFEAMQSIRTSETPAPQNMGCDSHDPPAADPEPASFGEESPLELSSAPVYPTVSGPEPYTDAVQYPPYPSASGAVYTDEGDGFGHLLFGSDSCNWSETNRVECPDTHGPSSVYNACQLPSAAAIPTNGFYGERTEFDNASYSTINSVAQSGPVDELLEKEIDRVVKKLQLNPSQRYSVTPRRLHPLDKLYTCDWPDCSKQILGSVAEIAKHIKFFCFGIPYEAQLNRHSFAVVCQFPECEKTVQYLHMPRHIALLHFQSLAVRCPIRGCRRILQSTQSYGKHMLTHKM